MSSTSGGPRSRDGAPPTDDQLIRWFESGKLLNKISNYFDLPELDAFRDAGRQAGALAASGKLDILSLIESGAVEAVDRHAFFNVQQFYNEAIPIMEEPVTRMLTAIDTLVKIGGADMAASLPNGALREWLRQDLARAEVVILGADNDPLAAAHLAFALEAVGDPGRARTFLRSKDAMLQASALSALARTPDPDPVSRAKSIEAIGRALSEGSDDMLCANAIEAILALASQEPLADTGVVLTALHIALAGRGDGTLNRAAHALWAHRAARSPDVAAALLEALRELNPEHLGTINELDLGLKSLIDSGQDQAVLHFLADLLVKDRGKLKARAFNSVWDAFIFGPAAQRSAWIVSWLISGEGALGFALTEVLSQSEQDNASVTIDPAVLPTDAIELAYLARKAVGWFMLQPRLATRLLVAILGVCDNPTAQHVGGLLAHPILRNYPEMREALESVPASDPAKLWTDLVIQENELYLSALRATPKILELTPSDHNRRIQHLHQVDQMQAIQKSAREQSVFFDLVHHSTVLYGIRSLTYVEDLSGGPRRPMEMELGTHQFSMAMPRLDVLDPIGLQLLMVRFRGEAQPQ